MGASAFYVSTVVGRVFIFAVFCTMAGYTTRHATPTPKPETLFPKP
jgi:hypothetical protein